jgi:methylthioxylose transferase
MAGPVVDALRRRRLELATLAFVAATMAVGTTLPTSHDGFWPGILHSTFLAAYRPWFTAWTILSALGLTACVGGAVAVMRLRPASLLWASALLALASRVALNVSRRGPDELAYPFTGPERHNEYIAAIPLYRDDPVGFLHRYADLGSRLPEHPAGHPPGATVLLGALAQAGFPGAWPEVALVLALGAATAPLTLLLARQFLDRRTANVATVLWLFAPSVLVESATSIDAIYAFAGTATALLLVRSRVVLGAVAVALSVFLSYALAAVPVWVCAVVATRRAGRAAALAVASVTAVVGGLTLLWWATGYDPVAAFRATQHRYFLGAGHRRPYWFWLAGDPAAFGLALGVPTLLALVRSVRRRFPPALALAAIVIAGTLSGFTKGEVERIWLFMVPLAAIAAAPVAVRWPPILTMSVLAGQALAVEVLFRTPW